MRSWLVEPSQRRQVDERVPFGHLTAKRHATGTRDPDLIAGQPRLRRVTRELAVLAVLGDEALEIVADGHARPEARAARLDLPAGDDAV